MAYTVTFSDHAMEQLASLTLAAFNNKLLYQAIANAANRLENTLKHLDEPSQLKFLSPALGSRMIYLIGH